MGWFEHGSTIIVLGGEVLSLTGTIKTGSTVRMGEALMRTGETNSSSDPVTTL